MRRPRRVRIVSDAGAVLAKHVLRRRNGQGVGAEPRCADCCCVSLLSPPTGSGRRRKGQAPYSADGCGAARQHPRRAGRTAYNRGAGEGGPLLRGCRNVDIDGQLFTIGRVIADEPLPVKPPKRCASPTTLRAWTSCRARPNGSRSIPPREPSCKAPRPQTRRPPSRSRPRSMLPSRVTRSRSASRVALNSRPRIRASFLVELSEDGERLIWIRDDGSAQIVPMSAGRAWRRLAGAAALYGRPWHEWTKDFLTVNDGSAARWTRIYRAENLNADAWKASLGGIAPDAGDDTVATTIALHPGGRIAAIGATGTSRGGVSLIDALSGKPLLDAVDIGVPGPDAPFFPRRLLPFCPRRQLDECRGPARRSRRQQTDCR